MLFLAVPPLLYAPQSSSSGAGVYRVFRHLPLVFWGFPSWIPSLFSEESPYAAGLLASEFGGYGIGDVMASRYSQSSVVTTVVSNYFDDCASSHEDVDLVSQRRDLETASSSHGIASGSTTTSMAYLPHNKVLSELRHGAFEACVPTGPSDNGLVSKWRPKDRVRPLVFVAARPLSLMLGMLLGCCLLVIWRRVASLFASTVLQCLTESLYLGNLTL
ncbi:Regulatory-associated protein of TOR 1 [Morella rubra]|uniref:Regulatory-associated protein of TOR 1 n=1 Tax=Morella rubra TaxID=262757 RepID=A0A6A1WHA9_9ROSI|nr:Regulatory-associated protein of TOR 1 [Morella rubra]